MLRDFVLKLFPIDLVKIEAESVVNLSRGHCATQDPSVEHLLHLWGLEELLGNPVKQVSF